MANVHPYCAIQCSCIGIYCSVQVIRSWCLVRLCIGQCLLQLDSLVIGIAVWPCEEKGGSAVQLISQSFPANNVGFTDMKNVKLALFATRLGCAHATEATRISCMQTVTRSFVCTSPPNWIECSKCGPTATGCNHNLCSDQHLSVILSAWLLHMCAKPGLQGTSRCQQKARHSQLGLVCPPGCERPWRSTHVLLLNRRPCRSW